MILAIYQNVKSCIKDFNTMSYSGLFNVTLCVKQGEPLSPLLFILFINDVNDCIHNNNLTENDLSIYMLLFADDFALFTTKPESLQLQLNALYDYSCKWGLKINVKKTKICIFEKKKSRSRFRLSSHCLFIETGRYNGTPRNERKCVLCTQNVCESEYRLSTDSYIPI